MSILLDSLRKSEAQRVMGDGPSIYSDGYDSHAGRTSGSWVFWLLLVSAFTAMTWFGLRQYAPSGDTQDVVMQTAETANEGVEQTSAHAEVQAPPLEQGSDGQSNRVDDSTLASTDGSWALLAEDVASYTAPDVSETAIEEFERPDSAVEEPVTDTPAPIEELERVARVRPVPVEPGTSAISYWSLPQSVRDGLGELRITVLVYAEEPENRFVLMNGERLQEQDTVPGGAVLEEIRREGAVFTYRNYRFLVAN